MAGKKRLDVLLTEQGLAESRQKAQAIIMAGQVFWDGRRMDKAGASVPETAQLEIRGQTLRYVSRGGLKLEKAMQTFDLPSLEGVTAIDAGASTGGFTDCMLQNGAAKVYAVDVGYGQLAWRLRNDPRVVCMERTNVRYLTPEDIPEPLDFGSVDVSFISLRRILPALRGLMKDSGQLICLIKPQFEAGKEKVGKKGVVRDKKVHLEVLEQFLRHAEECHFYVKDVTFSPIRGPEGNIEYLGQLTVVRYLTPEDIPEPLDFGSVDVSFISLRRILPALRGLMKDSGQLICLIKPQFEAGKEKVGKKGVVRDKKVHLEVLEQFLRHAEECHFYVKDVTFSPIRGPEGNIEYLGQLTVAEQPPYTGDLAALVEESHKRLEGNEP